MDGRSVVVAAGAQDYIYICIYAYFYTVYTIPCTFGWGHGDPCPRQMLRFESRIRECMHWSEGGGRSRLSHVVVGISGSLRSCFVCAVALVLTKFWAVGSPPPGPTTTTAADW